MSIAVAFLTSKVRAAQAARGARHPWFFVSFVQPRRRAASGRVGVFSIGGSVRRRDAGARRVAVNVQWWSAGPHPRTGAPILAHSVAMSQAGNFAII